MNYSVLTPYLIPKELEGYKIQNIGDGFILLAIKNILEPFNALFEFSSRKILVQEDFDKINSTKALIVAGANPLNDEYTISPSLNLESLKKIKVPIIFLGVGYSGLDSLNLKMTNLTKNILLQVHSGIEYSSWRCPITVRYLEANIPEIKSKFLMTGCPVIYGEKLLSGQPFTDNPERIAVTITERGNWWGREKKTIDFVANKFKGKELFLVLHQDFTKKKLKTKIKDLLKLNPPARLIHWYAQCKGFKIIKPVSVEICQHFYDSCDLHIGSRLHAHLYCLSNCSKSFLTYVDGRATGFSEYLGFPAVDVDNIESFLDYDFEIYRTNVLKHYKNMNFFINYLKEKIL
ncbi:MAG: hypothetical protein US42_C0004G0039 [Candidatus Magasanikbacteria bacterium GW2011_GWC2_37_14]|uniref:Polysaccharide pyruvyl transferase domain-containing protein n=1 Tax=Candidatus Magasanikbacteria bacterium GW2011_GWC2_37_14 TaxID=1619046 RepID=A0A0G0GP15_9BACT|nr:MAG: hypothetical protein US42_C0004G0039 [Candidatus Magasanikbacteria bacterium GW2011_GWC2_37_14]